eukprot:199504-Rhodomonas_salina.2
MAYGRPDGCTDSVCAGRLLGLLGTSGPRAQQADTVTDPGAAQTQEQTQTPDTQSAASRSCMAGIPPAATTAASYHEATCASVIHQCCAAGPQLRSPPLFAIARSGHRPQAEALRAAAWVFADRGGTRALNGSQGSRDRGPAMDFNLRCYPVDPSPALQGNDVVRRRKEAAGTTEATMKCEQASEPRGTKCGAIEFGKDGLGRKKDFGDKGTRAGRDQSEENKKRTTEEQEQLMGERRSARKGKTKGGAKICWRPPRTTVRCCRRLHPWVPCASERPTRSRQARRGFLLDDDGFVLIDRVDRLGVGLP